MARGRIRSVKTDNGYGFIKPNERQQKDIFFHMSALEGKRFEDVEPGDEVTYEIEHSDKGPRARVVRFAA